MFYLNRLRSLLYVFLIYSLPPLEGLSSLRFLESYPDLEKLCLVFVLNPDIMYVINKDLKVSHWSTLVSQIISCTVTSFCSKLWIQKFLKCHKFLKCCNRNSLWRFAKQDVSKGWQNCERSVTAGSSWKKMQNSCECKTAVRELEKRQLKEK